MCQGKPPSNHHTESKESADKFNTIHDSYTDEELRKIIKDCLKYDPSGRLEAAELLEIAKTKLEQIKDSPYQSALIDIRYSEALKGDSMKNLKSIIEKNKEHFNPKSDYKGMYTPLHKAFQYRNLYAVDLLLNKDFSLLDEAEGRVTPLHLAFEWIKELNERILELEIRKNKVERDSPDSDTERLKSDITASKGLNCSLSGRLVDASQKNKTIWKKKYGGWTLLHSAAAANCVTIVKSVLKNEPGWNLCTDTNWTLVHIAARNSYMELLKMLLSRKTDIEKVSKNEGTPLFAASKYGRMDAVSLLLQEGANVNVFPMVLREDKKAKMTALHVAALGGHAAVVKVLLGDKNINIVNKRTDKGETALHLAVMNSHKSCDEVISTLVESKKLNIEEKANLTVNGRVDEYTPLHIAVETCNVHGVRKLLYCRADPNSKTKNENTSLHLAARNGFKAIAQILLEEVPPNTIQADPNKLNRARNTPLHEAIENDVGMKENDDKRKAMNEIAELLIKHNKTRCSEINKTGETALHIAARNNIFKLFKIAYPYCKEAINLKTYKDKETALHVAARLDRLKIVKFLCDHQDNVVIEAKDARGRTPLQVATGSAKKELIQRFGQ